LQQGVPWCTSTPPNGPAGQSLRRWSRFTERRALPHAPSVGGGRSSAVVVVAAQTIEVIPEFLYERARADGGPVPPHVAVRLGVLAQGGARRRSSRPSTPRRWARCIVAAAVGMPAGVAGGAQRHAHAGAAEPGPRSSSSCLARSVNSLVWALLFVAVFGPGALAGALAIACRSIGFVGKLLLPRRSRRPSASPIEALTAAVRRAAAMLAQGLLAAGRALVLVGGAARAGTSTCASRRCWGWWARAGSAWRWTAP
jgi:phosphonate transport system permease protein